MKTIRLHCAALFVAATALFSAPNVLELGTLREVSMPYVGYYDCTKLQVGGKDMTDQIELRLELKGDGTLTLTWDTGFGERSASMEYVYEEESESLLLTVKERGKERKIRVPYEEGAIAFTETLGGRLVHAKFSRK